MDKHDIKSDWRYRKYEGLETRGRIVALLKWSARSPLTRSPW